MSLIRRAAAQIAEYRGADPRMPWGDSTPVPNSLVGARAGGIAITQQSAEQIAAVYGCCALLADSISSLPTQLRDGPDRATTRVLKPSPLLEQPYAEISRGDWWTQFIWSLALRGNFYGQKIEFDKLGFPVQIKPIHNDAVQVRRLPDGTLEYRFYGKVVPLSQVFHVRFQSSAGNVIGLNPIQVCALAFGMAIAQDRYAESFFLNSATPSGVIQVPGALDNSETKKMLRGWLAAHQGLNQSHLPAVLTEGAVFNPITISPEDSQLLEALAFSEQRICGRIFRVPPHMVGMVDKTTSWGRGIEQQERGFFFNTLVGYISRAAEAMTSVHPPGQFCYFDVSERLRGTAVERAQTASLMMLAGAWNADDSRAIFDMPPLPSGQGKHIFVPINTQLLEQALATLHQEEEAPPPVDGAEPDPAVSVTNGHGPAQAATRALLSSLRTR